MKDNLKRILEIIPFVVPVVYVLGFIIVNGQLSNFNYSDYSVLNFTYLKAGIVISFLMGVYFLTVYYSFGEETMTDDLNKSWPSVLLMISKVLFVTLIFSMLLTDFKPLITTRSVTIYAIIFGTVLYSIFRFWSFNKRAKNNLGIIFLTVPSILILAFLLILLAKTSSILSYFILFTCLISLIFSLSLGEFGDKNYNARIVTDIILLVASSFFFGKHIYGELPGRFGGGEPYIIGLMKSDILSDFVNKPHAVDTVMILYQNNDNILIKDKRSKILFINKSKIEVYEILKRK